VKNEHIAALATSCVVLFAHSLGSFDATPWWLYFVRVLALFLVGYVARSVWVQESKSSIPSSIATLAVMYSITGFTSPSSSTSLYPLLYGYVAALAVIAERKTLLIVLGSALLVEFLALFNGVTDTNTFIIRGGLYLVFTGGFLLLLRSRALFLKRQHREQVASTLRQVERDAQDFRLSESLRPGSQLPEPRPTTSLQSQHRRWLGSVKAIRDALDDVLELARLSVQADAVMYFAYNEDSKELKLKASIPNDIQLSTIERPMASTEGALGAIIKTRAPIRLIPKEPGRYLGHSSQRNAASFLGVPMLDDERLCGILVANRLEAKEFHETDEKSFNVISGEVLRAVESERIFSNLDRMRIEQERFFEAFALLNDAIKPQEVAGKLLEAADRIREFDFAAVTSYDSEKEEHQILRLRTNKSTKRELEGRTYRNSEGGLVVMALKNGHPLPYVPLTEQEMTGPQQVFGENGHFDLKSIKVFPMIHQTFGVGALAIGSRHSDSELSDREIRMFETISDYAAATLSNASLYGRMERMATTDGLTGLNNRRRFLELVDEAIARAERFDRRVSILMVDADHFKSVNDNYGHPVGDLVLKKIAGILQEEARRVDVVGRFGGEEFIAMLDETNTAGALQVAERMRQEVESCVIQGEFGRVDVTVSMGLATYPEHGSSVGQLIDEADKALYSAKENGRNQVRVAGVQRCADPKKPGKRRSQDRART